MNRPLGLALLVLSTLPGSCSAPGGSNFQATVIWVSDGDSLVVVHRSGQENIRLYGIDCPERGQPYADLALAFTCDLVLLKEVRIHARGRDAYGRLLAEVTLPDGRTLHHELLKAGLAWWYRRYAPDRTLAALEGSARATRRGLWASPDAIPPWDWRDLHREPLRSER